MITIYNARKIITMNPAHAHTTHVAVRDGKILGTGSLEDLQGWGDYTLDERFADKVLMPGLIEAHSHLMEGSLWAYTYVGFFDRMAPDGQMQQGCKNLDDVLARMKKAEAKIEDPDAPMPAWSLDPIYFGNERVTRHDLDKISATRPIGIMHASGHIMNVNTKALELAGMLRTGVNHDGVPLGADGLPLGELKGPDVMTPVSPFVGFDRDMLNCDEAGMWKFGQLCVRAGVTTATDLANKLPPDVVDLMGRVTGNKKYPARVVSLRFHHGVSPEDLITHAEALKLKSTDMMRLGKIKVIVDGSIQGFSARLREPGYYNGAPNGLWYISPEHLAYIVEKSLEKGIHINTHTNGDQATQLVIETMTEALKKHPSPDHRFTLQHCQLADVAQFRKIAKLGMCVNLFANHHFYWGDQHYALTVGPERAERMNACATALRMGVPMAIHSDAPITPLAPLFTGWCAVNRLTASGRTLGEAEKISVADALYAITLGAAYTLHLDQEVGSIEAGKRADFAVLEDDPEEIGGDKLKDVRVWGTVQGGRIFAVDDL
ncbi:amidohydrolase [Litoreibacter arenae]|uniref:Exoenzymes regulatory protein AepA in lipid-linked oligosaccharide synthesis cluster n=1 Tax=Litoreibacter arenae DSM 19593 TaxID=1123360 RepID=S9QIH5_9RHOB|nr:amidohydrolase [Litoreibacter arenae]EPX79388.1 Exoenzymes regulatory protein AepA in lipid-linked oligosaccharide synthesis cluster [Litoreibacter arenae DSM 19593]